MDLQDECAICKSKTIYSCITCDLPVCNRPTCSTAVDPKHQNYSEEHQKKVSKCKNCQDKSIFPEVSVKKKTKQVLTRSLFSKTAKVRFFVLLFIIIQNSFAHKGRISNDKSR